MRYIYKITNKVNGKHYIGQTNNLEKRWQGHLSSSENETGYLLHGAINKHGSENFEFELIESCEDEHANDLEKKWILHYESFGKGYNLTSGGDCEFKRSDLTIQKISDSKLGHEVSEETRRKIGDANRGRVRTQEARDKMSQSRMGHEVSEETRNKIREKHLNKTVSEETRKKISESKKGKKQDPEVVKRRAEKLKGKKLSEEAKRKIGLSNSRPQSEERRQKTREAWERWRQENKNSDEKKETPG
jgi:group I intron endonuclease